MTRQISTLVNNYMILCKSSFLESKTFYIFCCLIRSCYLITLKKIKAMFKKGLILVCLASLLTVYQLNAQDDFSLGPRVGLNFSNVSNVDESSSLTGLV